MEIEFQEHGHNGAILKFDLETSRRTPSGFVITQTTHNYELDLLELGGAPARHLFGYDKDGWYIWAPDWAVAFNVCDWCFEPLEAHKPDCWLEYGMPDDMEVA